MHPIARLHLFGRTVGYATFALLASTHGAAAQMASSAARGTPLGAIRLDTERRAQVKPDPAAATSVELQTGTQRLGTVAIGSRVRVRSTALRTRVAGRVVALDEKMVTLAQAGGPLSIPVESIESFETSAGTKRQWLRGLGIGVAVGVGTGFAQPTGSEPCGANSERFCSRGAALATSMAGTGLVGAGIGALIKTERWTRLEPRTLTNPRGGRATVEGDLEPHTGLPARSFGQLGTRAKAGDDLKVTDRQGHVVRGRLATLSPASMDLLVAGSRRTFIDDEVLAIERRGDSLRNGALWGLAIVGGFYSSLAAATFDSADTHLILPYSLVAGGVGAAVGTGIDALMSRTETIYTAPRRASAKLTVSPILGRDRKGIDLSLAF